MAPFRANTSRQDMSKSSGSKSKKRKYSETYNLTDLTSDQEAREVSFKSDSHEELNDSEAQSATRTSPQEPATPKGIDLDQIADEPKRCERITIDSDSDDGDEEETGLVNIDEFSQHLYIGSFFSKIVGVQHYRGRATTGESVHLRREPDNAYDCHAIQCLNVNRQQIGHIPAQIAAGLAPWLENKVCLIEGSVKGKAQVYSIPLQIDVFAQIAVSSKMPQALARAGIELDDKSKEFKGATNGPTGLAPPSIEEIRAGAEAVTIRSATAMLDELTVNVKDLQKMTKAQQPRRLSTMLLDYQLQGLHWMLEKENPHLPLERQTVQMWTRKGNDYYNIASQFTCDKAPKLARGGLLADDMGLGKTLQMLSLIIADDDCAPGIDANDDKATATLVICPTSLMSNWIDQCQEHISADQAMTIERYHGSSRSTKAKELSERELVVTTYGILTSEYKNMILDKKAKDGLFAVQWKRIILDEAHKIRNAKSQVSLAVHELKGDRRWCLTGTPVVNTYNDIASILRFVRWTGGIEAPDIFNSKVTRKLLAPGETVHKEAVKLIKILMQDLSLRRRKDMTFNGKKLIDLPEITEYIHKVKFRTDYEQITYDRLSRQAQGLLKQDSQNPSQVLEILLRMRQACCAVSLISEERLAILKQLESVDTVEFTPDNKLALQHLLALAIEASDECPICLDSLLDGNKTPIITYCKHTFCRDCICGAIAEKEACPLCRATLKTAQILEAEPIIHDTPEASDAYQGDAPATKIEELIKILEATQSQDSNNKTIVFSQWTKLLDIIESTLAQKSFDKFTYCRIDGSMSLSARDSAIKQLHNDTSCTIMLASLAVASVGLNLTCANAVILMDPWWSLAIEDQAIDRVFRLGQKRAVTVYKMVIEGSVEEKVLDIQERKRKMTTTVGTAGKSRSERAQTRREDMNALLGGGGGDSVAAS